MAPLGDKPWVIAPGPLFPTHDLYIVPTQALAQDANGLPTGTPPAPVQLKNANGKVPRVRLGAKQVPTVGGAVALLGDAWVSNLDRLDWPMTSLLGAQFYLDSPTGELYDLMDSTLQEAGPATWEFALKRVSQPRT